MLLTLKPLSKASCCAVCVGTGFGRDNTALDLFVLFAVLMKGAEGVNEAAVHTLPLSDALCPSGPPNLSNSK